MTPMDNAALERRARATICEDVWLSIPAYLHKSIINGIIAHGAETREACAKVAEEHADSCAQARGNAGAFNDRHAVWQAEAERMASLNIAAAIRSLPDALPLPGEGDGE